MPNDLPNFLLSGKTIVITGGGGILGQRMTAALTGAGAAVAILEPEIEKGEAAAELAQGSGSACAFAADITDPSSVEAVQVAIESKLGPVYGLVNNAAVKTPNFFEPFETFPLSDWNEVMNVNLTGAMICSQAFGKSMVRNGGGAIVNTLSIYGVVAPDQRIYEGSMYEGRAINTPAVYTASKAGLWGLTKYLAAYWGDKSIRVNAISPGGVFSGQNEAFKSAYSDRVPMGRMAEQDEMSGAVVFLLSEAASFITGQNIIIDGGLSVW